jgi:hypothetical protein
MLAELQQSLVDLYRVDHGYDLTDYLITDASLARVLAQDSLLPNTDESVLLFEDDDGLALSVYLDQRMLDRLDAADPLEHLQPEQLNDFWTVLEGISHFNYIVWCASSGRSVTLLELEMQAEVDKFVTSSMLASEQGHAHLVTQMHTLLFDKAKIRPDLDREQHARYVAASEYAGRFCHQIQRRLLNSKARVVHELRSYYRLSQTDKISHIHSRAWAST